MEHTPTFTTKIFAIFLLLSFCLAFGPAKDAAAENSTGKTVAVLPFEMHTPSSMDYLQEGLRDMLATRLAANGGAVIVEHDKVDSLLKEPGKSLPQKESIQLAQELGADYVITGSLTSLGGSMSIDAKVFAADAAVAPMNFYTSAARENEVIGAINRLSWDIAAMVFSTAPPVAALPAEEVPPSPAAGEDGMAAFKTEHPDKVYKTESSGQSAGVPSPIITPESPGTREGFTKTQNVEFAITGMDVGDIDGDGELDIVLADRSRISVYHLQNNRLVEFGSVDMPARSKVHSVSLGDMDGNGRAEVYISAADDYKPHSWAYEWDNGQPTLILEDIPWYIRILNIPGEGPTLIGQRGGQNSLLLAGIFKLKRDGTTVLPTDRLAMPDYVNLFDFALADVNGDGAREIVAINPTDRLYVIRPDGSVLWVSEEYYGGTSRFIGEDYELVGRVGIDVNSTPSSDVITREGSGKRIYLPSRLIITDVNGDGKDDVIVDKNLSYASRHIENFKSFKNGEIHAMAWNGIALRDIWQSKRIDGYIPDFQFIPVPGKVKGAELFVGVVLSTGWTSSFTKGKSTVIMYPIELAGKKGTGERAAN